MYKKKRLLLTVLRILIHLAAHYILPHNSPPYWAAVVLENCVTVMQLIVSWEDYTVRTLTALDLLDTRNTTVLRQYSEAPGSETAIVEWRRRKFKVTVDDSGTHISEITA